MSDEDLVDAYRQGRITRRVFVRHLMAGGISLAAAFAYSVALRPNAIPENQQQPRLAARGIHQPPDNDGRGRGENDGRGRADNHGGGRGENDGRGPGK
jgi:hypothetical protein